MRFEFGRDNYDSRRFGVIVVNGCEVGEEAEELAFSGLSLRGEKEEDDKS